MVPAAAAAGDGLLSAGPGRPSAQWTFKSYRCEKYCAGPGRNRRAGASGMGYQPSGVLAIPKASSIEHVEQNAAALDIELTAEERALLEKAYPAPGRKTPLDMV